MGLPSIGARDAAIPIGAGFRRLVRVIPPADTEHPLSGTVPDMSGALFDVGSVPDAYERYLVPPIRRAPGRA